MRPDGVRTLPEAVPTPRALSLVSDGDGELHSVRRSRAATRVKSPRGAELLPPPAADNDDAPPLVTAATASAWDAAFGLKLRRKEPEEAMRPRQAREKRRYGCCCELPDPSGVLVRTPNDSASPTQRHTPIHQNLC